MDEPSCSTDKRLVAKVQRLNGAADETIRHLTTFVDDVVRELTQQLRHPPLRRVADELFARVDDDNPISTNWSWTVTVMEAR